MILRFPKVVVWGEQRIRGGFVHDLVNRQPADYTKLTMIEADDVDHIARKNAPLQERIAGQVV